MAKDLMKLKVGIIGCGRISVRHFSSAETLPNAEVVACCDIVKQRADQMAEKHNVKAYYSYQEMLENEKLDVVHICLPHNLHTVVAEYAFSKGVHVLTEKPMAIDYESAENAVNKAQENGVLYGVIFQCRYNDSAVKVKEVISSGKLGKILSARSTLTWARPDDYYSSSNWKGTWEYEGGGVVIDQAIHSIDLVNWLVNDEIESVSVSMANRNHKSVKVEDSAEGLISYKNGVKYGFYCMNNYACDEPIEIRLYCEKGKVVFNYDDAYIYYNDGEVEEVHQKGNVSVNDGGKEYWGYRHIRQIEQFYKACLGQEELEISGKEALKTHKLICEIYKKGKENFSI